MPDAPRNLQHAGETAMHVAAPRLMQQLRAFEHAFRAAEEHGTSPIDIEAICTGYGLAWQDTMWILDIIARLDGKRGAA